MGNLYKKLGVRIPEILLPAKGTDLHKWSVIACDQYTSQPEYWQSVSVEVGDSPSTLRLTFPEIYLKDVDKDDRIKNINSTMDRYLAESILEAQKPGFILVDRSTPHAASRKGLIMALDLECYDYSAGSKALIRATEGTVLDRIPPRVKIRENAPIELPHIMVLIDDPGKTVIEALFSRTENYEKLYDFELMQGGGHIKGWKVDDEESLSLVENALWKLAKASRDSKNACIHDNFTENSADHPLLFAVGDGNHSLATAKAHWENVKAVMNEGHAGSKPQQGLGSIPDHPARYALVEVVNVHDDGLAFEPIHRVIFGVNGKTVLENIKEICNSKINGKIVLDYKLYDSKESMEEELKTAAAAKQKEIVSTVSPVSCVHCLPFILEGKYGMLTVKNPPSSLEVGTLQVLLDELVKAVTGLEIDYIHGEQVVTELGSRKGNMGFYLPVMDKRDLFPTVVSDGVLPRKTFSMGEAEEKRYYLECRCIR